MVGYRMRDLCALTGLSRQAIHFYIQQGLVPEGTKTGRNMAYYGAEHVERLRLVRRLQDERFLPLKQIRAVLDGDTAAVADSQRELLHEVRARMTTAVRGQAADRLVDVDAHARAHEVERGDVDRMIERGLLVVRGGGDGDARLVTADALWLVELWGQLRRLGLSAARGFAVDDLMPIRAAVDAMVAHEAAMVRRLADLPPARLAELVERALPVINALVVQLHGAVIRGHLATLH